MLPVIKIKRPVSTIFFKIKPQGSNCLVTRKEENLIFPGIPTFERTFEMPAEELQSLLIRWREGEYIQDLFINTEEGEWFLGNILG